MTRQRRLSGAGPVRWRAGSRQGAAGNGEYDETPAETPMAEEEPLPPRGARALLSDKAIGPFFAGMLVLSSGIWTFNVTAAVVVYSVTGSPVAVGLVTGAQFAAPLLLSVWSGRRADRYDRLNQVLFGQLLGAVALIALLCWTFIIGLEDETAFYAILSTAAAMGVGFCVSAPALQAMVPNLVTRAELHTAVTIHAVTFNLGRAIGPALAGVLFISFDAVIAIAVSLASYLTFITVAVRMRHRRRLVIRRSEGEARPSRAVEVLRDRTLRVHLFAVVMVGLVSDPVITLAPALADRFGTADTWIAALAAVFGAGAVSILFISAAIRRRAGIMGTARFGLATLAVSIATLAFWQEPVSALVLSFLAGAGFLLALSSITTAIQHRTAEERRGTTMALWTVAFLGSRPLSAMFDGAMAQYASTEAAMSVLAVIGAATCLLLRSRHDPAQQGDL